MVRKGLRPIPRRLLKKAGENFYIFLMDFQIKRTAED